MKFQLSYFKSWKMMLLKGCTQYVSKFGKVSSGHRTGKGQFSFQSPKRAMPKNGQTTTQSQTALISHASKVTIKILQTRLQQYVNWELQMHKVGSKRQKNQRSNCQHLLDHRKTREFQKNIYFCFIDYAKAFDCVDHNKLWKIIKRNGQTNIVVSWEICMQVKHQQLESDMDQPTGSKLGKEYVKTVYCHPAYLTYMQSSLKCQARWSTNWNQDCQPRICR